MKKITDSILKVKGVGKQRANDLARLGIYSVEDLLSHYPFRYEDRSQLKPIHLLDHDQIEAVLGYVVNIDEQITRNRMTVLKVLLRCETGSITLVWFNQRHIRKQIAFQDQLLVTGKVNLQFGRQISVQDFEVIPSARM